MAEGYQVAAQTAAAVHNAAAAAAAPGPGIYYKEIPFYNSSSVSLEVPLYSFVNSISMICCNVGISDSVGIVETWVAVGLWYFSDS